MTKNLNEFTADKKIKILGIKNNNIPILRPIKYFQATEEAFSPQKRTSSTSKHEISCNFFLILWVTFALLDPDTDPLTSFNPVPSGSGSETLAVRLNFSPFEGLKGT
jgi:hypothetical protein